jgi:hypothetical protein
MAVASVAARQASTPRISWMGTHGHIIIVLKFIFFALPLTPGIRPYARCHADGRRGAVGAPYT